MRTSPTLPLGPVELWTARTAAGHRYLFLVVATGLIMMIASALNLATMKSVGFMTQADDVGQGIITASSVSAILTFPTLWAIVGLVTGLFERSRCLRLMAVTDPVTGVANRRGFQESMTALASDPGAWVLVLLDIDDSSW